MILKSTAYDNCFLLTEGVEFQIAYGDDQSMVFSEADANTLMQTLTGFELAKVAAAFNAPPTGLKLDNAIRFANEASVLGGDFQVVEIRVDGKNLHSWNLALYTKKGQMNLPKGIIVEIFKHLVESGVEKAWSFGKCNDIAFVNVLPEITEDGLYPSEATVFVLTKTVEDKVAGSAWRFNGDEYVEFSDVPPEANPEDSSTIPNTEDKEEAADVVGGSDVAEAQVWNNKVTEKALEVTATESASIVNSVVNDGAVKVTVG